MINHHHSMANHHRFSSPAYDELMANHAICLLTYVAEHPDKWQSYGILSKATGIPPGTIWGLLNWEHFMAPNHAVPLFFWADNLGYIVEVVGRKGLLLTVTRSTI